MAKIYRRDNLIANVTPKPKSKKRKRSVVMNFRVLPEEKRLIDDRIALSGLGKADFFIQSCMYQKISTFGNIRTFEEIKRKMLLIDKHLQGIERTEGLDVEILESLRMILEMLDGLDGGNRQP